MAGGISIHVYDVSRGVPAAGLRVELRGPDGKLLVDGKTAGPGTLDDFQRSELVKIMDTVPGVSNARWSDRPGGPPLIAEASGLAILGFLLGVLVAYLIELRRRYNAQWTW